MSGLLHRLGARATGSAWTVRSDVRLPLGQQTATQETPAPQPLAHVPHGQHSSAPTPAATPLHATVQPASATQPALPVAPAAAPLVPLASAPPWSAPHPPERAATTEVTAAADAAVTEPAPLLPPHAAAVADGRPQRASTAPTTVHAPTVHHLPDAPAPMLTAQAAHPSGIPAHRSPQPPRPTAFATVPAIASPDTEVHIHIGRIDVTAVHENPRPAPRSRERAQPMSLDDYLARKRGTS